MGFRGDAIVELDWTVGEIRKTLERLGIAENTMIIFCSDNGPVMDDGYEDGALEMVGSHRAAGPFTGGKYSVYEGGTRTPFITWWPGKIKPAISGEMVSTMDIAASVAALAGVNVPDQAVPDSMDVSGALLGVEGAKGREYLVQQDNGGAGNFGLRVGDWKLIRQDRKSARNTVVEEELANNPVPRYQLFYLPEDPAERHDLAAQYPEILARMIAKLDAVMAAGHQAGA